MQNFERKVLMNRNIGQNIVIGQKQTPEQIQVFVIVRDLPLPDISRHTLVRRWDVWKRVQLSTVLQFTKVFPFSLSFPVVDSPVWGVCGETG